MALGAPTTPGPPLTGTLVRAVAGVAALCGLAACTPATTVPAGPWPVNDPQSTASVDHSAWDAILAAHLRVDPEGDGVNRFDFRAVGAEDRRKLKDYLRGLSGVDIAACDRDEQIAFWMNLYNAAIADTVLDAMPVDSVLDIPGPGLGVVGPWLRPVATVAGHTVTFDDIEHRILRVHFADMGIPIHYGVNCASAGCPPLAPRAHTAANWRDNLATAARQFVNGAHGVRIDGGKLRTSKIYRSWFRDDFGGSDESVVAHLIEYAEPDLARRLGGRSAIAGDFYDWRLSGVD